MSKRKILEDMHAVLEDIERMAESTRDKGPRFFDGASEAFAESAKRLRKIYQKWDKRYGYHILPSGEPASVKAKDKGKEE